MVSFLSDNVYHIQEIKHLQQFKFTVKKCRISTKKCAEANSFQNSSRGYKDL